MECSVAQEPSTNLQTFVTLNMHAVNRPEIIVASVSEKIDENGNIKDEKTRAKIRKLIQSLVDWTRRLKE